MVLVVLVVVVVLVVLVVAFVVVVLVVVAHALAPVLVLAALLARGFHLVSPDLLEPLLLAMRSPILRRSVESAPAVVVLLVLLVLVFVPFD